MDERVLEAAVREGLLTAGQAEECREVRRAMQGMGIVPKSIGEIAVEKGHLTRADLERLEAAAGPDAAGGAPVVDEPPPSIPGYRILGPLEEDERSLSFQAFREETGEKCVLRTPRPGATPEDRRGFVEDARRLLRVSHGGLVSGLDADLERDVPWVALQMAHGETLARILRERGPLEGDAAREIVRELAVALQEIHEAGLVHGEVHPRRIVRGRDGHARLLPIRSPDGPPPAAETVSPERVLGETVPGPASDLYSLGATWFLLLTGRPVFAAETEERSRARHLVETPTPIRELRPEVDEGTARLIARLLQKEPRDRPASAAHLVADIDRVAGAAGARPFPPVPARSGPAPAASTAPPAAPPSAPPVPRRTPAPPRAAPRRDVAPPSAPAARPAPAPARAPARAARPHAGSTTPPWMLPVLVLGVVLLVVLLLVYVKQEGTGIPPGPDRFRRADRGADPEARRNGAAAPERSGPGRPGPGESGAEGGEDPFSAVVPPLLPEDEGDRGAGEGDGPVRPEAGEAGATGPETGDAGPAAVAPASTAQIAIRRRQFVGEVLDACEIHDFPAADGICERSIEDPVLAELALPTRRAVAVVMAVVAEARRTIAGWAGTERTLHLRSGGTSSRRIMEVRDDRVMVALDVEGMEGGGISIGFDALGARTILEAGKVPAGLPTALVRLLLYRDAPGAAGALEDADARVREPYDGLLLFLEFDASLARADEAYAEERWRRALDAYLDLRARYPEPELFGADTGRIEQRLRNCLLLSRVAGRFHVDVETEGGALVFRYRLDEPRELADWTGGAAWLDDEARTATWTGRLEGDVSIEMDVEPRAGDLWMQFHGGDGGRDGYVFRLAQGNWRLAKMVDGVEATPMASTGATVTDRAYPVRVERTGGAIRVHVDGRPAPALRLEDDAYHGGELRVGGEPRALRQIRIAGRPPVDFPD